MEAVEKGTTRRHTFFCTHTERHAHNAKVIQTVPKEITVFGRQVKGWLVTTEESVISRIIPLDESLRGDIVQHDPE